MPCLAAEVESPYGSRSARASASAEQTDQLALSSMNIAAQEARTADIAL